MAVRTDYTQPPVQTVNVYWGRSHTYEPQFTSQLVQAVGRLSGDRFKILLSQEIFDSQASFEDKCKQGVLSCSLAICQFNGGEIDPGAIDELAMLKMAEIPTLILHTNLPMNKTQKKMGEMLWNSILSQYPSIERLQVNTKAIDTIAQQIIDRLNTLLNAPNPKLSEQQKNFFNILKQKAHGEPRTGSSWT